MTIKATLAGPADEPPRSTYNIGGKPGGRVWSSIAGIDTTSAPWYESYGNGGKTNTSPWPAPEFDPSRIPLGRTASKLGKLLKDR